MMHTSRHHALDRAQHLYRLPQVRVGALALGGFLECFDGEHSTKPERIHTMLTTIITLFLPIMLMGCAIVVAEWFDR